MRNTNFCFALLASAAIAAPAAAQVDLGGGVSVSGTAALVTDYRFRGISFTDEDIAIQGSIDFAHDSGFYVGAWGSSLEEDDDEILLFARPTNLQPEIYKTGNYGHTEVDLYAGWSGEVSSGIGVDVGVLYYFYPNARNRDPVFTPCNPALFNCVSAQGLFTGYTDYDTDYWEPYASVSYSIGPAELTTGVAWAPSQDAIGNDDNLYVFGDAGVGIPNTPVTLKGHLGYTNGSLSVGTNNDYLDWLLGIDVVFGPVTAGLAYIDTDAPSVHNLDATLVGSISISF